MAYSADDIATLQSAIATGALKVRYANGSEVTYRSLSEMKEILRDMRVEISGTSASRSFVASS